MSDDPSKTKVLPDGPAGVLPPGAELNSGMYRVTRKLAEGGFGITYEARDNLERKVAIKECFPAGLALRAGDLTVSAASASTSEPFETARNLFLREARTLANLRHPNIVHVQTLFEENGTAYMAMDYVEGRDLQDVIDNNADLLTPTYLMELTRTLLGALDYLHRDAPEIGKEPLLHRDIKPANIRIDPLNAPVIIDFGAAKQESKNRSRAAGTFRVVSDGYSPSEFYVANSTQGPQSDLYSLAATLYHCISGGKPVPADERAHALQNGKDDPFEPLAGRYPGHDPRLLGLIDRALSLPFKDRPKDAAAWFAAIPDNATRIVETPSPAAVVAPVVDTPPPPPAPNNSGFWKGALVGGGLLALLGGAAYFALPGVGASSGDMEEVQRQLEEATGARTGLEAELAAMSAEADDLQAEVAEATEARDLAQARVQELGDTISSLRAQLAAAADGEEATTVELRNQLNQATQELGDRRAAAQDLEAEVAALEAALSAARSAAPGESEALAEAEVTIERLGTDLNAALARQVQAEQRAEALAAELAALEASIENGGDGGDPAALAAAIAARDAAERDVDRARSDLERMAADLAEAEAEADRLTMELRDARAEISLLMALDAEPRLGTQGSSAANCPSWAVPGTEFRYTGTEIYTPQTLQLRASGTTDLSACADLPSNATGFTDQIPDFTLYLTEMEQFRRVELEVLSSCATNLLVNSQDTAWHFDAGSGDAGQPLLNLTGQAAIEGRIDIWVGTPTGAGCDAALEVETWLN